MSRERLPDRRATCHFEIEHDGLSYTVSYSRYEDGRLGEIFVNGHKVSRAASIIMADAAILASLALQHGCPLDTLATTGSLSARSGACWRRSQAK